MNMDYCKPYAGRDTVILDRHAADTIAEDIRAFDSQLENHFAHVIMLAEQKIITRQDAAAILKALLKLKEMGPDKIPFRPGLTDLYSNVEEWLIDELGIQVGGRVHTGRSRNDMNSTIERMHARRTILDLCEAITLLLKTLLVMAQEHKETVIPAYTHHSQQAQPITLGHFYTSCFQMFSRDMERLLESYARVNLSTMGGAAVATTSFPVNRERVAELLGFDGFLENSMDATAALDFAYEPACAMAIFANNMGRMTESLLLWNINEVGISRLAAPYCSYSTIMPQKRNPVALETLRYSGEWTYGALMSMLAAMKAYPQGNGREPGFVVSLYYEIVQRMIDSAYLLEGIVRTLEVDKARALQVTADGFSTVTDLACHGAAPRSLLLGGQEDHRSGGHDGPAGEGVHPRHRQCLCGPCGAGGAGDGAAYDGAGNSPCAGPRGERDPPSGHRRPQSRPCTGDDRQGPWSRGAL